MKQKNLINSLKLAGIIVVLGLTGCCKPRHCRDCGHDGYIYVIKDKPDVYVGGDAIIINGDNNDANIIKGNNNNTASHSSGNQNSGQRPVRKPVKPAPQPKPQPKPEPTPAPEPKPEQEETCVRRIKTTQTNITITGNPNDVIRAAVILNGKQY